MEEIVSFTCKDKTLYGVLHLPERSEAPGIVVTMIIGGPQTRVGGHRLYVQLARHLCRNGYAVLRFDYEGMGDSEGTFIGVENAGPSIEAATIFLFDRIPEYSQCILWSICNGVSACVIYTCNNPLKVAGIILCNPDTRTEMGDHRLYLRKYYYKRRLVDKHFWIKLFLLRVNIIESLSVLFKAYAPRRNPKNADNVMWRQVLVDKTIKGIVQCGKPIRFILGSKDLIANKFLDTAKANKDMNYMLSRKEMISHIIKGADHTFSEPEMKEELFRLVLVCVKDIVNQSSSP